MIVVRREPRCLSDLKLDQLLSGELSTELEMVVRGHLAECERCDRRRELLASDRAAFPARAPSFEAVQSRATTSSASSVEPTRWARIPSGAAAPQARPRRAPLWASGFALSAALVVLGVGLGQLGLLGPGGEAGGGEAGGGEAGGDRPPAAESTRTKGTGPALGFVVRRAGQSFWGEPGQRLHPGDELRFTLSTEHAVYIGVWGIDARGRVSPYHSGAELERVGAGTRQPLAGAIELDGTLGEERLLAVFCAEPQRTPQLEKQIRALAGPHAERPLAPSLPAGCSFEALTIVKALP